ncbi:MAG: saccharopine dehydrogenase C-terminal domain-containing protein [Acidimicrobiia bacterium]|nr:saccharopine dehydrogenase C-terminal domain-containing protein [Acidimicrobiia bacterium]
MAIERVAVMGLGKIGLLAAELLVEAGFDVTGHDARTPPEITSDLDTVVTDLADPAAVAGALTGADAVLSCLPYHLNAGLAEVAHGLGIHYFDLTEDVATTARIIELAETADRVMAPQCGLAPGFVGIVAASQIEAFDRCRSIRMRVGALPRHPTGLMGYAFNWSPEGVVNEYLNDCEVIEGGVRKFVSPMEWHETIYVDGTQLEAFTTSGGLGTMCSTYLGRVENLDYKTMRYPGHMRQMNFFFHELLMRDRRELAGEILTNAKPPVDEDIVYIHIAAEGTRDDQLLRQEFVRAYRPIEIAGRQRTAIAWTTASSVAAVIELVRDGVLAKRGFLQQEEIPLEPFLATTSGHRFA